jgi:hypothetical protein
MISSVNINSDEDEKSAEAKSKQGSSDNQTAGDLLDFLRKFRNFITNLFATASEKFHLHKILLLLLDFLLFLDFRSKEFIYVNSFLKPVIGCAHRTHEKGVEIIFIKTAGAEIYDGDVHIVV